MRRHEGEHPGGLIHIDIKKLGASIASVIAAPAIAPARATAAAGWEFFHVFAEKLRAPSSRQFPLVLP